MKLFDGVIDMLDFLKSSGKKLYICTNRSRMLLDKVLEENNIAHFFDEFLFFIKVGLREFFI